MVREFFLGILSILNGVMAAGAVWVFTLAAYALLDVTVLHPSACVVLIANILLAVGASIWSDFSFDPPLEQAGFFFALLVALKMLSSAATRSPDIIAGAGITHYDER